jgi:multiple sugar transport system permease protein
MRNEIAPIERDVALSVRRRRVLKKITPYLLLAPALIILCIVMAYPLAYNIGLSLFKYNYAKQWQRATFVGARNYIGVFLDPAILYSFRITLTYTMATLLIQFLIGLGLALLFDLESMSGKRFFRAILLIPMMSSSVVIGYIWKTMLNPDFGLLNYIISRLGFGVHSYLGDPAFAFYSVIGVGVWMGIPFNYLMLTAALRSLPEEVLESSRVDGANGWQQLIRVKLPMMRPIIALIFVFQFISVFGVFGEILVLTAGGPGNLTKVLSMLIYEVSFTRFDLGQGATLSIVYALIVIAFAFLFIRVMRARGEA